MSMERVEATRCCNNQNYSKKGDQLTSLPISLVPGITLEMNTPLQSLSIDSRAKTARCVVTTCLSAATLPKRRFDFLFIDEAGQASEPDIMIPIGLVRSDLGPRLQYTLVGFV